MYARLGLKQATDADPYTLAFSIVQALTGEPPTAFVGTPLCANVLGPDGKPWLEPPPPPFRIWPVEKCVDRERNPDFPLRIALHDSSQLVSA